MTLMVTTPTHTIPATSDTGTSYAAELAALHRECARLAITDIYTRHSAGRAVAVTAAELEWCEKAEEAVDEANCWWPSATEVSATLVLTIDVTATLATHLSPDKATARFLHDSLDISEYSIQDALELDSDWTDVGFTFTSAEVTHLQTI